MTSAELAEKILDVCQEASGRILGVGDEQYATKHVLDDGLGPDEHYGTTQRTEVETLEEHLQGLEEELLDTINHAAMSILKLRAARA